MTSNLGRPQSRIRNSARATCAPDFEFRISNFEWKLLLLLALPLCLGGWPRPAYGAERVWEKKFQLPPGGHVSVVNVHGSVLVEGWDRAEVEATVAMRSEVPTDQLDDVQVAVEASSGGVAFHTLYPSGLDTPIRVDYRLRVPRQVRLDEISTLEGDIVVHDVEGSIEARNLHGDIEGINVSGSVVAHALTGNILVSLARLARPPPADPARHHQWQCRSGDARASECGPGAFHRGGEYRRRLSLPGQLRAWGFHAPRESRRGGCTSGIADGSGEHSRRPARRRFV